MRVDMLDPVVAAAPGDTATCRVRVVNDALGPATYRVRMVGLHEEDVEFAVGDESVPSGGMIDFDVDIAVPRAFAAGRHALAVEVRSDRRDERPALAGLTVEVSSIQQVTMAIDPSTIVGRLRGKFEITIDNREKRPVELDLTGEGQQLKIKLSTTHVVVSPGGTAYVQGKVKGPRRFARDTIQHVVTIVAEGRSAPVYTEAAYRQLPLLPRRLRSGVAVLVVVALWAGIIGLGALWFTNRDDAAPADAISDALVGETDGDPDTLDPLDPLDEGGTGTGTGAEGEGADGSAAGGADGEGSAAPPPITRPTSATVSGTVDTGVSGSNAGVRVSLTPTLLGRVTEDGTTAAAAPLASGGGESRPTKLWSSRYGRYSTAGVSPTVRTLAIETQFTDDLGAWAFPEVLIPDNYEINFFKEGFNSKSFVITPPEDGKTLELEVVLDPATGRASGVIRGPDGPLGGVEIVMTDGELRFTTTSSTDGLGAWELGGLSTPNVYTLTATKRGYGTEVVQVQMAPGAQVTPAITMQVGVGSIGGRIVADGQPFGGVTVTVSGGDLNRTTTSLTLGDVGHFDFPQLPIPGVYTVMTSAPGYVTQTREIDLRAATDGIEFVLGRTTATLTGRVVSNVSGPLPNVGITVRREDLAFESATASETTAAAPSVGSFRIEDLPPGSYVVSFLRYDHSTASVLVELTAGQVLEMGDIEIMFMARSALDQTGRIVFEVQNSEGDALTGATATLRLLSTGETVAVQSDTAGEQSSFAFANVPIGTYTLRISRPNYRTAERRVTVGLGEVRTAPFLLLRLGQVSGRVVDSVTGDQLRNYQLRIYRLTEAGVRVGEFVEQITVTSSEPPIDNDGNILWQSEPSSLTDGLYEIEVVDAPPGYRILADQVLSDVVAPAPMRFRISATDEDAVRLTDIEADPFPSLTGRIFTPLLVTPPGTSSPQVEFAPLDGAATVTLSCVGSATSVDGIFEDLIPTVPGVDSFVFSRETIEGSGLSGDCTLTLTSAGYDTADVALLAPLVPSDGGTTTNQTINLALSRDEPALAGQLYWVDNGVSPAADIAIDGVAITSVTSVIIGYTPSSGPLGDDQIVRAPGPLTTTSIAGAWALDGQVFGASTYRFTKTGYTEALITVTIDEDGRVVDFAAPTLVTEAADAGKTLSVYLMPEKVTDGWVVVVFVAQNRGLKPVLWVLRA